MKIFSIALLVALIAFAGGVWYAQNYDFSLPFISSSVTPTTTPTNTNQGTTTPAAQAVYHNASADKIVVTGPVPGASVANTFTVSGKARGGWYFEASFPLEVQSATGTTLVQMPVQAQGDWMTAEFVPFSVQVVVPAGYKGVAMLILKNDNPSGLPENEASISIPITIK